MKDQILSPSTSTLGTRNLTTSGLVAELVEHCTSVAEVMGSNPVQA